MNWFKEQLANYPDEIFIVKNEFEYSYSDIADEVAIHALSLSSFGITNNSKVLVYLEDPLDIVEIFIACMDIGAIFSPISSNLSIAEIQQVIEIIQPDAIVTNWNLSKTIKNITLPKIHIEESIQSLGCCSITPESSPNNPDDVCAILFTSGSTGTPKAVQLSYQNFESSAKMWNNEIHFLQSDNYLCCLPLHHIAGLSIIARALVFGFKITLTDSFDSEQIIQQVNKNNISLISVVPTMLKSLLKYDGLSTLRSIILGGAATSPQLLDECLEKDLMIYKTYGMTETCSGIAGFYINDFPQKIHTSGKPFIDVQITVKYSELVITSPSTMISYLGSETTKGIHYSGDTGFIDDDGFVTVELRQDNLIISGGENIDPVEITTVLNSHPKITTSNVYGVVDEKWGHKVIAEVILSQDISPTLSNKALINEINKWCKKHLAGYKVPKQIVIKDIIRNK
jgi:o-succinylbenzoate---CoA ligase